MDGVHTTDAKRYKALELDQGPIIQAIDEYCCVPANEYFNEQHEYQCVPRQSCQLELELELEVEVEFELEFELGTVPILLVPWPSS